MTLIFYSICCSYGSNIGDQTWSKVNKDMVHMNVSNALSLMDLVLSLPPTSVENERAFSQLKLVKTDRRHRLSQHRLNSILQIRLNGPTISDFNPDPAIDKWLVSNLKDRFY